MAKGGGGLRRARWRREIMPKLEALIEQECCSPRVRPRALRERACAPARIARSECTQAEETISFKTIAATCPRLSTR